MLDKCAILPKPLAYRIWTWLRHRKLRAYDFRLAQERDLEFILVEVFEGAKHGHYNPGVLIPAGARGLLLALKSVIQDGTIPQDTERGMREYRRAELLIYGCNTDDQVGYLLIAEKEPGTWD